MKCPFCQQELEEDIFYRDRVFVSCGNPNCIISDWGGCSKQIITEVIRTHKALEKAKSVLTSLHDYARLDGFQERDIEEALAEITVLEQKGLKDDKTRNK